SQVGWKPRFSPDGSRLTWERVGFWQAQWFDLMRDLGQNGVNIVIGGVVTEALGANEISAGGAKWAAFRPEPVRVYTSWGQTILRAGCPTLNQAGQFGYVDD